MLQSRLNTAPDWALGLGILVTALLVYGPTMIWGGFVWDDDRFLFRNPLILAPDGLGRFWFGTEAPDYFPLTSTTLWMEWRLWGMEPRGYHLTNILLHGLSSVLLWQIGRSLGLGSLAALGGALVFLVHPTTVMSVSWITERKNTLSLVLALASVWSWLRWDSGKEPRDWWLALALFVAALLAKTSVVMVPVVLILVVWGLRGRLTKADLLGLAPFFAGAGILAVVTIWFQYSVNIATETVRTHSFVERLLIAGQAVWLYAWKAVFPVGLSFVYPTWSVSGGRLLDWLPGIGALGVAAGLWHQQTRLGRWPAVVWVGYMVMLFPVLGFFDIYFMRYTLVSDHWQYGALPLLCLGAAALIDRRGGDRPLQVLGCVVLFMIPFSWWNQGSYRSEEVLWRRTLAQNPQAYLAANNLGRMMATQGKIREARDLYQEALKANPDYREAHYNLANLLAENGDPRGAEHHYGETLRIDPRYIPALTNYGNLLKRANRLSDALDLLRRALASAPQDLELRNNYGAALLDAGQSQEAEKELRQVLARNPAHPGANGNLGILLANRGDLAGAIPLLRRCAEGSPSRPEPWQNLAQALQMVGDQKGASEAMQRARQILPTKP